MGIIVEIIINAIVRAIVNAIIYSIAYAVNKAIAGAVTNGIEKSLRSKVLSELEGMDDETKARFVRNKVSVEVRRVGFGKYYVHFEENIFGIYKFSKVCYKKEIFKDIALDLENETDKLVERLVVKNKKKKIDKGTILEMEEVLNTLYTVSYNLMANYATSTGRLLNGPSHTINLQDELKNSKPNAAALFDME